MRGWRTLTALHTGIFAKLLPLAHAHNARVVLINRRGYPGAAPYTDEELATLRDAFERLKPDRAAARAMLMTFMRARAREVYDLLEAFVVENDVPIAQPAENSGGIVVVGWSFASAWMTSLLAHVAEFEVNDVELSKYVRRVIFHGEPSLREHAMDHVLMPLICPKDGPFHVMGYPPPEDPYNPLFDTALGADTTYMFVNWVSGYFQHGETADEIERRIPLKTPPPTLSTLTDEERASALYPDPGLPGKSDDLLLVGCIRSGLFTELRKKALCLTPETADKEAEEKEGAERVGTDAWRDVEVRYVWCDRSVWEMTWTSWKIREEMQAAKEGGTPTRNVHILRLPGSNHFVSLNYNLSL